MKHIPLMAAFIFSCDDATDVGDQGQRVETDVGADAAGPADAGSCCSRCGADRSLCLRCPGAFEECTLPPLAPSCFLLTAETVCTCPILEGKGTCEVVDGVARLTLNPAFCVYAADYRPPDGRNACNIEPSEP